MNFDKENYSDAKINSKEPIGRRKYDQVVKEKKNKSIPPLIYDSRKKRDSRKIFLRSLDNRTVESYLEFDDSVLNFN